PARLFHVKHASGQPRRQRGLLVAVLAAVALVAVGCGGIQQPDGWAAPAQVGDRVLVQARSGQLSLINPANGQPAWQYPDDDEGDRPFYATPIVDDDSVYVVDYKGRVARLDAGGGQATWVSELDAQVVATP